MAVALPHPWSIFHDKLPPLEKALAFMHGLWCDARKLAQVADLRRDPLVPELLGIRRVASQSVRTRFFQEFTSAGGNRRCFRPLWHWGMNRLPSRKEGVAGEYIKQGINPCLNPLLAMLWHSHRAPQPHVGEQRLLRQQRHHLLHGPVE